MLDILSEELKSRFSQNSLVAYAGLNLLPSKVIQMENSTSKKPLKDLCKSFFVFYFEDMPFPLRVEAELDLREEYWLTHKEICPSSIAATLKSVPPSGFSNIRMALKILATLPITSCECERSFSGMKRVKHI